MRASIKKFLNSSSVQRWFIFVLIASVAPFLFLLFIRWLEGAKMKDLVPIYMPDFLLVVLSVAVSTFESASVNKGAWRKGSLLTAGVTVFICWGLYWKTDASGLIFATGRLEFLEIFMVALFLTNLLLGVRAEYKNEIERTVPSKKL